jgi:hypothetical protein
MPINAIISQPAVDSIQAVYRPILFEVRASRTDGNAKPPVVYCDIYVGSVFYKSMAKTMYYNLGSDYTDWRFDIQDPLQEVFKKVLGANGGTLIINAGDLIATITCKFRSSGYDTNGFILSEATAPVQATGESPSVAGTGTSSNSFYTINAVLQHQNNQDLATHLSYYKKGAWVALSFPLTHRTDKYKLNTSKSDFFPIVYLGDSYPASVRLLTRNRGATVFTQPAACVPVTIASPIFFPFSSVNVPYYHEIDLGGTAPFRIVGTEALGTIKKPAWMTISISGNKLVFSGTPSNPYPADPVQFLIKNCGDSEVYFNESHQTEV